MEGTGTGLGMLEEKVTNLSTYTPLGFFANGLVVGRSMSRRAFS